MAIDDLIPDAENARLHPERNLELLRESLRSVGAARSVVVDERGRVLAGAGVLKAAPDAGITQVRVIDATGSEIIAVRRSGLSRRQKKALAYYDNRANELSGFDPEQVRRDVDAGLDPTLFWSAEELTDLLERGSGGGKTHPDSLPPVRRRVRVKRGQVFGLGRHRLACGDATDEATVRAAMGPLQPQLLVTEPPYGVNYDPTWRAKAGVNKNPGKMGKVANDDRADWREAYALFPGAVAYVWHGGLLEDVVKASLDAVKLETRAQIIWVKDRLVLSRGDYHWKHEPCLYAVRRGKRSQRTGDRRQQTVWRIADIEESDTTVWEVPARDDDGHGHGTQKPVECMARPMRNHRLEVIYDPFVGSGTSLIAAEQLGRRCVALDLDPAWVQLALDRWEAFTGRKARVLKEPAG